MNMTVMLILALAVAVIIILRLKEKLLAEKRKYIYIINKDRKDFNEIFELNNRLIQDNKALLSHLKSHINSTGPFTNAELKTLRRYLHPDATGKDTSELFNKINQQIK